MRLDPFSLPTAHLTLLAHHGNLQTALATATGFFVDLRGQRFLVTAWHNLTGRDPTSLKAKHSHLAIPTHVRVRATYAYDEVVPLYRDDSHNDAALCARCFWQHPLGPEIDIAVLRVPGSRDVRAIPVESIATLPLDRHRPFFAVRPSLDSPHRNPPLLRDLAEQLPGDSFLVNLGAQVRRMEEASPHISPKVDLKLHVGFYMQLATRELFCWNGSRANESGSRVLEVCDIIQSSCSRCRVSLALLDLIGSFAIRSRS
jgi:hypothetical protein